MYPCVASVCAACLGDLHGQVDLREDGCIGQPSDEGVVPGESNRVPGSHEPDLDIVGQGLGSVLEIHTDEIKPNRTAVLVLSDRADASRRAREVGDAHPWSQSIRHAVRTQTELLCVHSPIEDDRNPCNEGRLERVHQNHPIAVGDPCPSIIIGRLGDRQVGRRRPSSAIPR